MSFISLKCKNCGSGLTYNDDAQMITCSHCGSTFMLSELLDEKDLKFLKTNKEKNIDQKLEVGKLLKEAETFIYQAEYRQAEECYKKVIELDEDSYKGYFGVVRAKTSNFNKVPDSNDYKEYAKIALKYADSDEVVYVKSELAKLEMIDSEKKAQKRELIKEELARKHREDNYRANEKFFAKITYFLILFTTAVILVCVFMTGRIELRSNKMGKTFEITNAIELKEAFQDEKNLNATFVIKNNIDMQSIKNTSWKPVGTKSKPFTGKVYGNGYVISNLQIKLPSNEGENYAGFFGYCKDAYIFKLALEEVDIISTKTEVHTTNHNLGFICGIAENTTIKQCDVKNTCNLEISHVGKSKITAGGIAGKMVNSSISGSNSNASLTVACTNLSSDISSNLNFYVGGLVGYFDTSNIIYSFSKSNISTTLHTSIQDEIQCFTGGIIAYNISSNSTSNYIKNCYFEGEINSTVDSTNKKQYIAGIVSYGANLEILQNNIVLNINSFKINHTSANVLDFYDYSLDGTHCTYYNSAETFNNKVSEIFAAA